MFDLSFDTANAAFDYEPASEVARILRDIAQRVEAGADCGTIRDHNGNTIGNWSQN